MKKMNKKGFTLIEMLVVIAIIAILVSIVVPVVGNSTAKAAAATNAANLRSYASQVAILYLNNGDATVTLGEKDANGAQAITITAGKITAAPTAPTAKKVGSIWPDSSVTTMPTAKAFLINGEVYVTFNATVAKGTADIDYFSYIAEHGEAKAAAKE